MRFTLSALCASFLFLLVTVSAATAPSSAACAVSPDPALVGSDVMATATGLDPLTHYYLYVDQPGNQIPGGAHPSNGGDTDAAGTLSIGFNLATVYGGPLEPGTVQIRFKGVETGHPSARCSFEVVA
jgi:hypothetical protein